MITARGPRGFFSRRRREIFSPGAEEAELEGLLLRAGVLEEDGGRIGPGQGRDHLDLARVRSGAAPDLRHARIRPRNLLPDPDYRSFATSLWSSVDSRERWFWRTYFGWAGYDVGSDYLMGNEFQAYLLQQPVAAADDYFAKRKSAELLAKHPELKERMDAYMGEFGSSFAQRAKRLEDWLYAKYSVEAGRTAFLTRDRG